MNYFFKFAIVSKLDPVITTGFFKLSLPSCQWQRTCNKCKWLLFDHAEQQINSFRTILDISICSKWMLFSQQIKNVSFQMNSSLHNLNLQNYIYTVKCKLFYFFRNGEMSYFSGTHRNGATLQVSELIQRLCGYLIFCCIISKSEMKMIISDFHNIKKN